MQSREADLALDKLSDDEFDALAEASLKRWFTRVEIGLVVFAFFGSAFALACGFGWLVRTYWSGSWVASIVAVAVWSAIFLGSLKVLLSGRISQWLAIRGARREIRRRGAGKGAP